MLGKAKPNFVVDALVLGAFISASLSGVILLTMPHAAFRGGRDPAFYQTVLFLNLRSRPTTRNRCVIALGVV
jgi:hypothetical protein